MNEQDKCPKCGTTIEYIGSGRWMLEGWWEPSGMFHTGLRCAEIRLAQVEAEVERLRADLQEERTEKWKLCADQATEIKRLRAALEPFVVHYKRVEFWDTDKVASYCLGGNTFWIRLAELCEAAEAAAKGEGR